MKSSLALLIFVGCWAVQQTQAATDCQFDEAKMREIAAKTILQGDINLYDDWLRAKEPKSSEYIEITPLVDDITPDRGIKLSDVVKSDSKYKCVKIRHSKYNQYLVAVGENKVVLANQPSSLSRYDWIIHENNYFITADGQRCLSKAFRRSVKTVDFYTTGLPLVDVWKLDSGRLINVKLDEKLVADEGLVDGQRHVLAVPRADVVQDDDKWKMEIVAC